VLTRRDNFLKTLKHQSHERIPAFFVIDGFNLPQPLPEGLDLPAITGFSDIAGLVELSKYYGLDTLLRITPSVISTTISPHETRLGNGLTSQTWRTPKGDLQGITAQSAEANTVFTIEHPIRELEDYEKLYALFEQDELAVNYDNIAVSRKQLEMVGEEGIAYTVGPATPIMDLTRSWAGLDHFIYHLADAPGVVESVLERMAEQYYRQYELIAANSPCEVIVFWDDVNSLYLSPRMFQKYSLPVQRRFAEIAHRYGKLLVNHTCGKIAAYLGLFGETGVDAVDWVTPAPSGDVEPHQVQACWGERITMMLAVVPELMRNGSPDQVEAHLHDLLNGLDLQLNLVFMVPAPIGTPLANARRAVQVLCRDYGVPLNRSQPFGSIIDRA
jgi:uroporphyrinogen-III decarboxylase